MLKMKRTSASDRDRRGCPERPMRDTRAFSVPMESERGSNPLVWSHFLDANWDPLRWKTL
jgi:hypothetical protein